MKRLAECVTGKREIRAGYTTIIEFVGARPRVGGKDNININRKEIIE
jgi:hypothetical protein